MPLPQELIDEEVGRRDRLFGRPTNDEQAKRRSRIVRITLEAAWRDFERYGAQWARVAIRDLEERQHQNPHDPALLLSATGYSADDLRAVLARYWTEETEACVAAARLGAE